MADTGDRAREERFASNDHSPHVLADSAPEIAESCDDRVREEIALVLPESLGPVGLRRPAVPALGVEGSVTGYGDVLLDALLPTMRALMAEAAAKARATALDDAAHDLRNIAPTWVCDVLRGLAISDRARSLTTHTEETR